MTVDISNIIDNPPQMEDISSAFRSYLTRNFNIIRSALDYLATTSDLATIQASIAAIELSITAIESAIAALGTAANENIGTSGANVPLLNAANSWSAIQTLTAQLVAITDVSYGSALLIRGTNAAHGASLDFEHVTASPAAADDIANIRAWARDVTPNAIEIMAELVSRMITVTAGAEDAKWVLRTKMAGALADRWHLSNGIWSNAATGGNQGADSINGINFYKNGVGLGQSYGYAKLGTITTTSGTTQAIASLTACAEFLLVWKGVSHNNGASQSFRVELSVNNGSSYGAAITVSAAVAAASTMTGTCLILGAGASASNKTVVPNIGIAGATVTYHDATEQTLAGVVNNIRVSPSAGSFDAGSIEVWGAPSI